MQNTLVDSGPLIALFDADDHHHARVTSFLQEHRLGLHATWPVLTEVCALLSVRAQHDFLEFVDAGGLSVHDLASGAITRLLALSRKYHDRPMDLADASLVLLAAQLGWREIWTLDADFDIYRLPGNKTFRAVMPRG